MATYTDQLVVYQSGSLKKIGDTETIEVHGIELTSSLTVPESGLTIGSTAVTSTAAELNALDGATSSNDTTGKAAILGTNGNLTIAGDLTVNGTTTTIESTTLTVDDKNIELGTVASPTDTTADGGGITLKGTTDKTFNWVDATDSWTSSEHLDLASTKEFKIAGTSVLSATTLGAGVTSSSLTSVGTLTSLLVDNVSIDGSTIGLSSDTDLITLADNLVTVAGEISVTTLDIGGTNVTATASELNVLDGDTAASSITLQGTDGLVVNDGGTMKQIPVSDLNTYISTSGVAADDISDGDAAVEISTSTGNITLDAPSTFSVNLAVNGDTELQVTSEAVTVSEPLVLGDTSGGAGIILSVDAGYATAIAVGDIVGLTDGASGGLELTSSSLASTSTPVGVALEASSASTADSIRVNTVFGSQVNVSANASISPGRGAFIYLDSNSGKVTNDVSSFTTGQIWRLGVTTADYSAGATSLNIIWMPQFIADLG